MADEREDQPASTPWAVPGQVTGPQPWPPQSGEWAPPPPSAQSRKRSWLPLVVLVGLALVGLGVFAVFQQMRGTERFEEYVGSPYADSALFVSTISPREQTWALGDREVVCLVFNPDGPLTGTVAGTGQ